MKVPKTQTTGFIFIINIRSVRFKVEQMYVQTQFLVLLIYRPVNPGFEL